MKSAKKAKKLKKIKKAKLPKTAIKSSDKREVRRIKKQYRKELIKKGKLLNKRINTGISIAAVSLCIISSALDVVLRNRCKNEM